MTALQDAPFAVLDENAHAFISTFMSNVTNVVGYGRDRITTISRVKTLLLAALANGAGSSSAWRKLYRTINGIVATAGNARDATAARAYLELFIRDNIDLADD